MVEYTEIEIAQALIAIADGLSIRTAAQQWGIPFSTAFVKRNPSIKVKRSRSIDLRRINRATADIIRL
ncbi:transposase [Colletotrichum incanum]|nr:transposase [Colletotrichum incanum]